MFMPGRSSEDERKVKQLEYKRIESLAMTLVPERLQSEIDISVQEVVCGDPECAPIDTAITIGFPSGGQGIFGMPMEAKLVKKENLGDFFPPPYILDKWHRGEEAEWPVREEEELMELRFDVGTAVECRVGPTDWAPGEIKQLWYREPQWPENAFAPYRVILKDGREIYAPADMDQVIRRAPKPADDDEGKK